MADFQALKHQVLAGTPLSAADSEIAFTEILKGSVSDIDMAAFLTALKVRGETPDEILGAVRVLRQSCQPSLAPDGAMDTCGTGGDGLGTLNVSTTVALVLAAAGVPVAKHGNRSVSSKSGSSDVLTALGVVMRQPVEAIKQSLAQLNIAFLFAPDFHGTMASVATLRAALKTRTIFNLLGPLANPAAVKRQLVGTYDVRWCVPMAQVLKQTGSTKAWVVHGQDGQDELSISGPTTVVQLKDGAIDMFEVVPEDAGLPRHALSAIKGGDAVYNAKAMRAVLAGERGAYFDAVVLNAAAGLMVADKASDLKEGAAMAADILASGEALETLDHWAVFSHQHLAATA